MYWHHGWGFGWFGLIFWLALAIIIIWLVFRVRNTNSLRGGSPSDKPMEILKTRYAKGEITKEDYERMKNDIDS